LLAGSVLRILALITLFVTSTAPNLISPKVLLNESLLTFLPDILIRSSVKVREILVGDLVSIALLFGFDETKEVCACAAGEVSKSRPVARAIMRFIIAKGISLCDIKRPSEGQPPEGLLLGRPWPSLTWRPSSFDQVIQNIPKDN
jgi:hypothetical protein